MGADWTGVQKEEEEEAVDFAWPLKRALTWNGGVEEKKKRRRRRRNSQWTEGVLIAVKDLV